MSHILKLQLSSPTGIAALQDKIFPGCPDPNISGAAEAFPKLLHGCSGVTSLELPILLRKLLYIGRYSILVLLVFIHILQDEWDPGDVT